MTAPARRPVPRIGGAGTPACPHAHATLSARSRAGIILLAAAFWAGLFLVRGGASAPGAIPSAFAGAVSGTAEPPAVAEPVGQALLPAAAPSPSEGPSFSRPAVDVPGPGGTVLPQAGVSTPDAGALRRTKCRVLWLAAAPWSFDPELCDFLVAEHERQGIPAQWYWSLVYGMGNFGLMIGTLDDTGTCYGPFDCKWGWAQGQRRACLELLPVPCAWRPAVLRYPRVNIRCHTAEMAYYHRRTGRTGLRLLAKVFLPAAPCEYGRWRPTDRQFRRYLSQFYRKQQAAAVPPSL